MEPHSSLTLPGLFQRSVDQFSDFPFLSFVDETPITYGQANIKVLAVQSILQQIGLKHGDRVALLSTNMPNWGITYLAITGMGAVVVPLLPDFTPEEIKNVLEHSEAVAIFVSSGLRNKIADFNGNHLKSTVLIDDFSVISSHYASVEFKLDSRPVFNYQVAENDLAAIIYTSGTTGKSKGVMLSHRNICFTAVKGRTIQAIGHNDRMLSVLPLSHTYENTIGFILPMVGGAAIYYLTKLPTPAVLLPALKQVRPTAMLTVPLIIEKIYKSKILPAFNEKWATRVLYRIPVLRKKLNVFAGKKLMRTFGGELKFFGIGGAKLNGTVERFLIESKFPYAIGYGLTETAPLLAGVAPFAGKWQSTGPAMEGVQLKIVNRDRWTGEGEIWAKGPNVMMGYYKEPVLTKEVLTKDGWFKTGDLGLIDTDGYLFIKGRSKNVIVGAGGENIFPEDIESIINNFRFVVESVVVEQKGKLVALVHFNREEIEQQYRYMKDEVTSYVEAKCDELKVELQDYVNQQVNKFSKIQLVVVHADPFQKTATQKIKRFLYTQPSLE
ncbi:MAG: AMP-binding protein [Bacteroidetes bacterium]|nr:AMP-binding protein [Bacteroidota bacterium]